MTSEQAVETVSQVELRALFLIAALEMRRLQKEFFKSRDYGLIESCKEAERKFDDLLDQITGQRRLFE